THGSGEFAMDPNAVAFLFSAQSRGRAGGGTAAIPRALGLLDRLDRTRGGVGFSRCRVAGDGCGGSFDGLFWRLSATRRGRLGVATGSLSPDAPRQLTRGVLEMTPVTEA